MATAIDIDLGAISDPLTKQLHGIILPATLQLLELDKQAITRLLIRGLISETAAEKARYQLIKRIQNEAKRSAEIFNR